MLLFYLSQCFGINSILPTPQHREPRLEPSLTEASIFVLGYDVSMSGKDSKLVLICGLPGAGKTTLARKMAGELSGVRFCPDEWMEDLGVSLWDEAFRDKLEKRFWVYEVRDNIDDCVKSIQKWLGSGEGSHIFAGDSSREQDVISEPEPIQPKPEYTTLGDDEVIGGYEFDDADEADEETEEGIEEYLRSHIQGYISIRYQSKRANSARRWRELKLIDFDDTFIYTEDPESERLIRYRRDGIVEHK